MNIKLPAIRLFALAALGLVLTAARAAEKPSGPNGGRLLKTEPRAEFFVTADRKVQITFLDQNDKAVAPGDQVVTVTAGERSAPKTMKFTKSGNALVSDIPLPPGNDVPAVIQIKANASAKTSTDKFNVDLSKCPDCKKSEYACVCH